MRLGEGLRWARENIGLSQVEVKQRTGINNKALSNYENNVSVPDPYTLKILADLYGVDMNALLGERLSLGRGHSSDWSLSDEDLELLRKIKNLPKTQRQIVDTILKVNEQDCAANMSGK